MDDKKLEADRQQDPRFKLSAEEIKAKGIKDYQLFYAVQTLRRTAPPAMTPVPGAATRCGVALKKISGRSAS